jgi:hypothetical protein
MMCHDNGDATTLKVKRNFVVFRVILSSWAFSFQNGHVEWISDARLELAI